MPVMNVHLWEMIATVMMMNFKIGDKIIVTEDPLFSNHINKGSVGIIVGFELRLDEEDDTEKEYAHIKYEKILSLHGKEEPLDDNFNGTYYTPVSRLSLVSWKTIIGD